MCVAEILQDGFGIPVVEYHVGEGDDLQGPYYAVPDGPLYMDVSTVCQYLVNKFSAKASLDEKSSKEIQ